VSTDGVGDSGESAGPGLSPMPESAGEDGSLLAGSIRFLGKMSRPLREKIHGRGRSLK